LFWPISDWRWSSPISYYNSRYDGREFFALPYRLILLVMAGLLIRRRRSKVYGEALVDEKQG